MGYDLENGHKWRAHFTTTTWDKLLALAEASGWQPAGTQLAEDDWPGGYRSNDGQAVTAADAADLAAALELALETLPPADLLVALKAEGNVGRCVLCPSGGMVREEAVAAIAPEAWFSGRGKGTVIELMDFCAGGEFTIH